MFLHNSSAPQSYWSLIGIGIRMAQDVGIHRKKVFSSKPTVHEEQWKRAFWYANPFFEQSVEFMSNLIRVLVSLDRFICMGMGRPTAIHEEEYELALNTVNAFLF
jgi:hypothetical protein